MFHILFDDFKVIQHHYKMNQPFPTFLVVNHFHNSIADNRILIPSYPTSLQDESAFSNFLGCKPVSQFKSGL